MRRLFSTFPASWPGVGLLLLRLLLAAPLVIGPAMVVWIDPHSASGLEIAMLMTGALIAFGFCTPAAALVQSIIQLITASGATPFLGLHAENALLGLSLLMLGPGVWSADAYLFGRRRITIGGK